MRAWLSDMAPTPNEPTRSFGWGHWRGYAITHNDYSTTSRPQPAEMPPKPAPVWIRVGVVAMALGAGALIPVPAAVMKAINALAARIIGGL